MENLRRLRRWMIKQDLEGILLSRRDNYAWITQGNKNHVLQNCQVGIATLYVRLDSVEIIADSSDLSRMSIEQNKLCAKGILVPWYESMEAFVRGYVYGRAVVSDTGIAQTENVEEELITLRLRLTSIEVDNYREIGKECAEAVEKVCLEARPGDREEEVGNRLRSLCFEKDISPDCVLVGSDERIIHYRHPMPTQKTIDNSLMIVLGGEKKGLNISMTRMVYFKPVPAKTSKIYSKVQHIFASMQTLMKDGLGYDQYMKTVIGLYEKAGYGDEWKLHHQGGPTGYGCREFVARPDTAQTLHSGQAYAWNPTITGVKCEETTYLADSGAEILTRTKQWPYSAVTTPYGKFYAADLWVH